MSGSDWGIHSKSCCNTPLGSMAVSTAWQISNIARACNFFYHRCVKCALSHISRAEVMRECDNHHTHSIKTNSAVNLSRKPGLDLCCDLLQHLQGVPRTCTCSFYIITRTSILLASSLQSVLTFNNIIMHILPLPPCGLSSIRAQNVFWQHRPCKIVLFDPGGTQGSHRPGISFMRNKYRTRANGLHETCGTEYQQTYRIVYVLHNHHLQSWVSTTHRSYSQLMFSILSYIECLRKYVFKNVPAFRIKN